ncbi:MAG TPA: PAS domain S-box protein, partial [Catalimonadaceae bacterium]|nr:PAS domain S-box protein [Catalimonadaceae bacterium]
MTASAFDHLHREKIKFEALFHYATIGILISNHKGEITHINSQAEQVFGYEPGELLNQKIEVLLPDSIREKHQDYRNSYTVHPEVRPMGTGRDLIAKRKNGSQFPVEVSLSYFHCEDGLFVIAFLQDVTLRKNKDETLQRQKQELEEITEQMKKLNANLEKEVENRTKDLKNTLKKLEASQAEVQKALDREKQLGELKSRFVTMASHEFKTPLSTILTSATLISKYKNESEQEQRDKHLRRISDSVQNLTNLLNEFLSLGKLDEGKVGLKMEEFNLNELATELAGELE